MGEPGGITTERRPCFIEAETYRFNGHSRSDKLLYRSPQDEEPHRNADPILRYLDYLKNESLADDALMDQYSREAQQLVQEALGFCEASSGPLTLEEALSLVRSGVSR